MNKRVLQALVFVLGLFLAACSGEVQEQTQQPTTLREASSEGSEKVEPHLPETTTTTTTTTPQTPPDFIEELFCGDCLNEALSMSQSDCQALDHYEFLEIQEDRISESGLEFYLDCRLALLGWFYNGGPEDIWHSNILIGDFPEKGVWYDFELDWLELPADLDHPGFEGEVTLQDLVRGDTYCVLFPDGYTEEFIFDRAFYNGVVQFENNEEVVFGIIKVDIIGSDGVMVTRPAFDGGLIPLEGSGRWVDSHVDAGSCPVKLIQS